MSTDDYPPPGFWWTIANRFATGAEVNNLATAIYGAWVNERALHREKCAKLADEYATVVLGYAEQITAEYIAELIRASD